jgi:hypothetical protein
VKATEFKFLSTAAATWGVFVNSSFFLLANSQWTIYRSKNTGINPLGFCNIKKGYPWDFDFAGGSVH